MKISSVYTQLEEGDLILVGRYNPTQCSVWLGQVECVLSPKQLLSLGMKIQSVINQIDKENCEVDEKRLLATDTSDDRRRDEFRRGDPGHPDNEMGM